MTPQTLWANKLMELLTTGVWWAVIHKSLDNLGQPYHWSLPQLGWQIMGTISLEFTGWLEIGSFSRQPRNSSSNVSFTVSTSWVGALWIFFSFRNLLRLVSYLLSESWECIPIILEEMAQLRENIVVQQKPVICWQ